jgi:hypothetical protein
LLLEEIQITDGAGFLANLESIFKQNSAVVSKKTSNIENLTTKKIQAEIPHQLLTRRKNHKTNKKAKHIIPKQKQFSQKAVKEVQHQENDKSLLILGGWDDSLFSGELNFHPVIRKSWWTLQLDKVLLNDEDTGLCDNENKKCQIIMDSGASLMATPPQVFNEFMSKVEDTRHCEDLSQYPRISFIINKKEYYIDPFEYILSNKEDIDYLKKNEKPDCVVGFSVFDLGPTEMVWIAGDIFLSKYYSVYDRDKDRVGLALAN